MFKPSRQRPRRLQPGVSAVAQTRPSARNSLPYTAHSGSDVVFNTTGWSYKAAELLLVKGFCIVDARTQEEVDLSNLKGFVPTPQQRRAGAYVADGLLGRDGSMQTRSLPHKKEAGPLGTGLLKLDAFMAEVAEKMWTHLPTISEEASRTACYLHKASRPGLTSSMAKPQKLTCELASEWRECFQRARLLIVLFLGPGLGILELGLFDQQSSEKVKVHTRHGRMVLIRPELLSRNHRANTCQPAFAISCFLLDTSEQALRKGVVAPMPHTEALRKFVTGDAEDSPGFRVKSAACNFARMSGSEALTSRALVQGGDFVTEVPLERFDVNLYFDKDLSAAECRARNQTYSKHGSFIKDAGLFDFESFNMTEAEGLRLLPSVRKGMEVAAKATHRAGFTCKVHQRQFADFTFAVDKFEVEAELLDFAHRLFFAYGGRGTFTMVHEDMRNIPYALGLTGVNVLVDTDGSSSLAALSRAMQEWHRDAPRWSDLPATSGTQKRKDFSVVMGSAWNLSARSFVMSCSLNLLSRDGHCRCFNEAGCGHVRAEGCAAVVLVCKSGRRDSSMQSALGDLKAAAVSSGGRANGTMQPSSSLMEASMDKAVMQARLTEKDVGVVECHARGEALADRLEVGAVAKVFPPLLHDEIMMLSTGLKTNFGSGEAVGGLVALLRVMAQVHQETTFVSPGIHLKVLTSGYASFFENRDHLKFSFVTECTQQTKEWPSRWVCVNSFGHTGVYASAVVCATPLNTAGEVGDQARNSVRFWPAGGGELEPSAIPQDGYYIAGSFNELDCTSHRMNEEEPGVWEAQIVLGNDQWESFRIYIDGDPDRALHPSSDSATRYSSVLGPDEMYDCEDSVWKVGRADPAGAGSCDAADPGNPGDRYQVRLYVAGKFRKVDWTNIGPSEGKDGAVAVPSSTYYVVAKWGQQTFAPMTQDSCDKKGLWSCTADLRGEVSFTFYIVRNKDPCLAFFPKEDDADDPSVEICGPEYNDCGHCWRLHSFHEDSVTIKFQRTPGLKDQPKVSWSFHTDSGVEASEAD